MISDKCILLVDDDDSIRTSMEYFFRRKTRVFKSVPTAEKALDLMATDNRWDAVISDYKLPGMDGICFLKQVKTRLPQVKTSLNPWGPGCYTSQMRLKREHRKLENGLWMAEKMA